MSVDETGPKWCDGLRRWRDAVMQTARALRMGCFTLPMLSNDKTLCASRQLRGVSELGVKDSVHDWQQQQQQQCR